MSKSHQDSAKTEEYLKRYMEGVLKRNPGEPEFVQAVYEVASSIFPYIADKPIYHELQILERMAEPERVARSVQFCDRSLQGGVTISP
jgi:glutamate dehydrogenase (NADP+)